MQRRRIHPQPPLYKEPWFWVMVGALVIGLAGIIFSAFQYGESRSSKGISKTDKVAKTNDSKYSFDGKTAKLPKYTIKIDKVTTQQSDDDSNKYVIVFHYTVHNKSDKDVSADSAWQDTFDAYQPRKNTERSLDIATVDSESDAEFDKIKKDGTAHAEFAYEVKNKHQSVTLKATSPDDKLIGKHKYKLDLNHLTNDDDGDSTSDTIVSNNNDSNEPEDDNRDDQDQTHDEHHHDHKDHDNDDDSDDDDDYIFDDPFDDEDDDSSDSSYNAPQGRGNAPAAGQSDDSDSASSY